MRVVVLLTFRNEARVLQRTLEHLAAQAVDVCLIDHGSQDGSRAIAESFFGRGVFRIVDQPYDGQFNLPEQMRFKERLLPTIDADWFLHNDADEIRHAPARFANLRDGIVKWDRQGYNAIEFNEFIFLPTSDEERWERRDFVAGMRHYYFFKPQPLHRLNAWKNTGVYVDLHTHFGHRAEFAGRVVAPEPFVMRHYIVLSRAHALAKYCARVHSETEIRTFGWNDERVGFRPEKLKFPPQEQLKFLGPDEVFDTSDPWLAQTFIGGRPIKKSIEPKPAAPIAVVTASAPASAAAIPIPAPEAEPPMPVIVGAARSGTTLLRLMLDAHPALAIPPETHFLPDLRALQQRPDLKGNENSGVRREEFLRVVTSSPFWKDFRMDEAVLRAAVTHAKKTFKVADGARRIYELYARAHGKPRWGDKTPPYVWRLKEIHALLPEAHFVHLIRDGRDVALSARGLWFDPSKGNIEDAAAQWLWRIREARQQAIICPHYLEVRYETLLSNPRVVLEQICTFAGLEYDPAMENYHRASGERLRAELHDQRDVRGEVVATRAQRESIFKKTALPPDPERAGRWRKEMSVEDRERFESVAGDLLRELGYETN